MADYKNYRQRMAINKKNRERLLKLNPNLNNRSGIYFWTRTDDAGVGYFYIGQAVHLIDRNVAHLSGYQHIDLSLKKRGLYSESNPLGWKLGFLNYPENTLDEKEQYWILEYMKHGYQARYNKTAGGQGEGKEKINEFKPARGYRDGLLQGRKNLAKELKHIVDTHLIVSVKKDTKTAQKALSKFNILINPETYEEGGEDNDSHV